LVARDILEAAKAARGQAWPQEKLRLERIN
jgi:hypothetical protein